jgi:hypothetical protein
MESRSKTYLAEGGLLAIDQFEYLFGFLGQFELFPANAQTNPPMVPYTTKRHMATLSIGDGLPQAKSHIPVENQIIAPTTGRTK